MSSRAARLGTMTKASESTSVPSVVPVFPLPGVVFFPASVLPLHIFEPRYRVMVEEALAGDRLIAMALPKPGWEGSYEGAMDVFELGCVGRIENPQKLPDGRYNLALAGLCRVSFVEFVQDEPFRKARIVPIPDAHLDPAAGSRVDEEMHLLAAFSSLHGAMGSAGSQAPLAVNPGIPFEVLVNSLCLHSELDAYEKQKLLELPDAERRCIALTDLLSRRLDEAIARGEVASTAPPPTALN